MQTAHFPGLFDTVIRFLGEMKLKHGEPKIEELEDGNRRFIVPSNITLDHGNFYFYIQGNEENGILGFHIRHFTFAPEEKRSAIAELITRINYRLWVGTFAMDYEDGEILFKATVDIDGMNLGFTVMRNLVYCCFSMMDKLAPAFERIIAGESTPEEALAALEAE